MSYIVIYNDYRSVSVEPIQLIKVSMPLSFLYSATAGFLVVATIQVSAQRSGGPASAAPRSTVTRATPAQIATPRILPGTRSDVFGAIQGNALTSTNGALANASVRLRDARTGRIIETQVTDQSGHFAFPSVDPGSYIVEIMGQDQYSVLAASQIMNVGAGEAVSTVVKLPLRVPPLGGILGKSAPSATAVILMAASAGVLATQASGAATCDTLQR